jgi:CRP/FNR family cyclic AMP-dependent transcriptional regulator
MEGSRQAFEPKSAFVRARLGKSTLEYRKNEVIFGQGELADTVFYIHSGKVKLTVVSAQGREGVIAVLQPGQFFGEGCLNGDTVRAATATALQDCAVSSIGKSAMLAEFRRGSEFSELFMSYLLARNSRIEADLADQLCNSSEKRLARLLLLLANYEGEGLPSPSIVDISQETLAEMVGTTRSRVSFFMNKFRRLGLISYDGAIEVHGALLNAVLHDTKLAPAESRPRLSS